MTATIADLFIFIAYLFIFFGIRTKDSLIVALCFMVTAVYSASPLWDQTSPIINHGVEVIVFSFGAVFLTPVVRVFSLLYPIVNVLMSTWYFLETPSAMNFIIEGIFLPTMIVVNLFIMTALVWQRYDSCKLDFLGGSFCSLGGGSKNLQNGGKGSD